LIVSVIGFWKGLQALRRPPVSGENTMIGERAVVMDAIDGRIDVRYEGEIWQAVSSQPLHKGQRVTIEGVDGLTLQVAPVPRLKDNGRNS
jgi:membrane-bound serine protease (ClpP class)